MIVEGIQYDDEEWRIARVQDVRIAGREHRVTTHHHGEVIRKSYACYDCKSVYFEEGASTQEDPPKTIPVNEKFLQTLAELSIDHGGDLEELQEFLGSVAREFCPDWPVPNLWKLRNERYGEGQR